MIDELKATSEMLEAQRPLRRARSELAGENRDSNTLLKPCERRTAVGDLVIRQRRPVTAIFCCPRSTCLRGFVRRPRCLGDAARPGADGQ